MNYGLTFQVHFLLFFGKINKYNRPLYHTGPFQCENDGENELKWNDCFIIIILSNHSLLCNTVIKKQIQEVVSTCSLKAKIFY